MILLLPKAFGGTGLHIIILPEFNGVPLVLSKQLYVSGQNDSLYIDAFRCYISSISLSANGKKIVIDSTPHLLDAAEPQSLEILVPDVPATDYDELLLDIGVDSLSNVSGAMGGDLDPTKGMYWAWNTGFINAKLEGRGLNCPTLHHAFEFHIGGYAAPYNSLRHARLPFKNFTASPNNTSYIIVLHANLAAWFNGIRLQETNSIVMPSAKAMTMADNYTKMFSITIKSITNER